MIVLNQTHENLCFSDKTDLIVNRIMKIVDKFAPKKTPSMILV